MIGASLPVQLELLPLETPLTEAAHRTHPEQTRSTESEVV